MAATIPTKKQPPPPAEERAMREYKYTQEISQMVRLFCVPIMELDIDDVPRLDVRLR